MISEIIRPEECDISYEFDLPVMVVHNDYNRVVLLTKFCQNDDNNTITFAYHGYHLDPSFLFKESIIHDYDIKNWSKFKGKVVLSNFAENE